MSISIHLVSKYNAEEILEFEKRNKDFFESVVPPRVDDYYNMKNLKQILEEIEEEQRRKRSRRSI